MIAYISGLMAAFFFAGWLFTMILGVRLSYVFLIAGLLLFLVYLPLRIHLQRMHKAKMEQIIRDYKHQPKQAPHANMKTPTSSGWSMNNSPFRTRKSGLNWGGGNIHASNNSRGTRKRFLHN